MTDPLYLCSPSQGSDRYIHRRKTKRLNLLVVHMGKNKYTWCVSYTSCFGQYTIILNSYILF